MLYMYRKLDFRLRFQNNTYFLLKNLVSYFKILFFFFPLIEGLCTGYQLRLQQDEESLKKLFIFSSLHWNHFSRSKFSLVYVTHYEAKNSLLVFGRGVMSTIWLLERFSMDSSHWWIWETYLERWSIFFIDYIQLFKFLMVNWA